MWNPKPEALSFNPRVGPLSGMQIVTRSSGEPCLYEKAIMLRLSCDTRGLPVMATVDLGTCWCVGSIIGVCEVIPVLWSTSDFPQVIFPCRNHELTRRTNANPCNVVQHNPRYPHNTYRWIARCGRVDGAGKHGRWSAFVLVIGLCSS